MQCTPEEVGTSSGVFLSESQTDSCFADCILFEEIVKQILIVEKCMMKRSLAFLLAVQMVVTFAACSGKTRDIDGVLTRYVQVEEYSAPLAVIEDSGKTFYFATSTLTVATDIGQTDDTLLAGIQNGEITGIEVCIDGAEKGKTIEIDGKEVTVWQSHQIYKTK